MISVLIFLILATEQWNVECRQALIFGEVVLLKSAVY